MESVSVYCLHVCVCVWGGGGGGGGGGTGLVSRDCMPQTCMQFDHRAAVVKGVEEIAHSLETILLPPPPPHHQHLNCLL